MPSTDVHPQAEEVLAALAALDRPTTADVRAVRKAYTTRLKAATPETVLDLAQALVERGDLRARYVAYELVFHHKGARLALDTERVRALGAGMDRWEETDTFGAYISGAAWRAGQIPDEEIVAWAQSGDRWWRRAALVSTTELNKKVRGGTGDAPRTLGICRLLVEDRDEMVVKALSWALRELAERDPAAVRAFLAEHEDTLAARVRREVTNKLETGLKNP